MRAVAYLGHTQVGYLQRAASGEQQVARLDVLVHNALAVQVLQAVHQLAEVPAGTVTAWGHPEGPKTGGHSMEAIEAGQTEGTGQQPVREPGATGKAKLLLGPWPPTCLS